jgi:hypothetical protein
MTSLDFQTIRTLAQKRPGLFAMVTSVNGRCVGTMRVLMGAKRALIYVHTWPVKHIFLN